MAKNASWRLSGKSAERSQTLKVGLIVTANLVTLSHRSPPVHDYDPWRFSHV
jgi:hypothetical protein